jgi:hypothetical protein
MVLAHQDEADSLDELVEVVEVHPLHRTEGRRPRVVTVLLVVIRTDGVGYLDKGRISLAIDSIDYPGMNREDQQEGSAVPAARSDVAYMASLDGSGETRNIASHCTLWGELYAALLGSRTMA